MKSRDTLFVVIRVNSDNGKEIPIAAFKTLQRAEEYAGQCLQEFLDKQITEYVFGVTSMTYYDE